MARSGRQESAFAIPHHAATTSPRDRLARSCCGRVPWDLAVLSLNALIAIERGLAVWPGELVFWVPLAAVMCTATVLLLSNVQPNSIAL